MPESCAVCLHEVSTKYTIGQEHIHTATQNKKPTVPAMMAQRCRESDGNGAEERYGDGSEADELTTPAGLRRARKASDRSAIPLTKTPH